MKSPDMEFREKLAEGFLGEEDALETLKIAEEALALARQLGAWAESEG